MIDQIIPGEPFDWVDKVASRLPVMVAAAILGIPDDEDFFETGYVNSLFAVQIVMFVESTLGVPVVDGDLDIANFSTINRIDGYANRKRAARWGALQENTGYTERDYAGIDGR